MPDSVYLIPAKTGSRRTWDVVRDGELHNAVSEASYSGWFEAAAILGFVVSPPPLPSTIFQFRLPDA